MKKQIILFDFDKTFTDNDSIFLLWKYAFSKRKTNYFKFIFKMIRGFFKFLFSGFNFLMFKNEMCSVLKYFNDDELEKFIDYIYEKHIYKDAIDEFNNLPKDSYRILASASPINYLNFLDKYFNFDLILGTNLDENYNVLGKNNKNTEKVKRIRKHLLDVNISIDYEKSKAYSDSFKADRPMLMLVKNRYLINSKVKKRGYTNLNWK